MRISTLTAFNQTTKQLNAQQNAFLKVGEQIASMKRVNRPSDDPLAMSIALGITQSREMNTQFSEARVSAKNAMAQEESVLASVSTQITAVKTLLVQAGSETLSDSDRVAIATEIKGLLSTITGLANSADGNGKYLFAGHQVHTVPFQKNVAGNTVYMGDNESIDMQVDSARLMPITDNGNDIFMSVFASAGLVARAGDTNTGSVNFAQPLAFDKTDPNYGNNIDIVFTDIAGTMNYSVNGGANTPYVPGGTVSVNGTSVVLSGTPATGDTIAIRSGNNGNSNLFKSLEDVVATLSVPTNTPTDKAKLRNMLTSVGAELNNNLDKVLTVRAAVGSKLNELDTLNKVGDNRKLNYTSALSDLIDLDYETAISEYTLRKTAIAAAQKTYVETQSMSLFNYVK